MDILDTTRNDGKLSELTTNVIKARKKIEENLQKLKRIIEGNEDCPTIKSFIENIETSETIPEISEELKQEISTQFEKKFNENDFIYILGYFFEHGLGFEKNEDIAKILYQKAACLRHPEAMVMVAFKNNEFKKILESYKEILLQFYKEIFKSQDDSELQQMLLSDIIIIKKIKDYQKYIRDVLSEQQKHQKTPFPETTPMFQIFEDTKKKMMEELTRCQQISKNYSEKLEEVKTTLQQFYKEYGEKTVFSLYNFHLIQEYSRRNKFDILLSLLNGKFLQIAVNKSRKLDNQLPFVLDEIAATELLDVDAITRLVVYYENDLFVDKDLYIANALHEFARFNKNSRFTEGMTDIDKAHYFGTASEIIKPYISKNDILKKMYITRLLKAVYNYEKTDSLPTLNIVAKCYNQILELNPENEYVKTKLADIYYKLAKSYEYKDPESSFGYCKELLKTNKFLEQTKRIDILYMMADFYENGIKDYLLKDFDEAIKCYSQILEYNENDSKALYSIAQCYEYQENYQKAIECYSQILEYNENDSKALYSIAKCYEYQEKYQEAFKYYIKYIQKISSVEDEEDSDKNIEEIDSCISFYDNHKDLFELTGQKMLIAYCFSKMCDAVKESKSLLRNDNKETLYENFKQLLDNIPTEKLSDKDKENYEKYKEQISEQNSVPENDIDVNDDFGSDPEVVDDDSDTDVEGFPISKNLLKGFSSGEGSSDKDGESSDKDGESSDKDGESSDKGGKGNSFQAYSPVVRKEVKNEMKRRVYGVFL